MTTFLAIAHLIGLALAVGAATVKLFLLLKCAREPATVPVYIKVVRPITRLIISGMILLTLSGVGWLCIGFPFSRALMVKSAFVSVIWILGPIIDNMAEPKFRRLAPEPEQVPSSEFTRALRQYLALEVIATALLYSIVVMWTRG